VTGPEHYAAADRELERIEGDLGDDEPLRDPAYRAEIIARAQVHATLALAAATAANIRRNGAADVDIRDWNEVLS
jgi:hypothetical protein